MDTMRRPSGSLVLALSLQSIKWAQSISANEQARPKSSQ